MKHLRKLAVLAVALVAVLALSVVAWALTITETTEGTFTVSFAKQIKVVGGTDSVCAPTMEYSYAIAETKIIEGEQTSVYPTATITSSLSFSNGDSASGTGYFEKTGTISATPLAGTRPGVYLYTITESTGDGAKDTAGITVQTTEEDAAYNNLRYLVVVVGNNAAGTGVTVQQMYLFKHDSNEKVEADKTEGWMVSDGASYDKYETTQVTITKYITGSYADKSHKFPFTVQVNCENGAKVYVKPATGDPQYFAMGASASPKLANGESVVITGIPVNANAAVQVGETNDTLSVYNLTTTGLDENPDGTQLAASTGTYTGTLSIASANATTDAKTITFTNALRDISGTGLVLRVAPYAIVVGAGAALFFVARRRKERVY